MHKYHYCITTAKKMNDFNIFKADIEKCIEDFNRKSKHSRNRKFLSNCKIHPEMIEIDFTSDNNLGDFPTLRPLWLLSKSMLEIPGINKYCVNRRFLKLLSVKRVILEQDTLIMTDTEILKNLIDIYMCDQKRSTYMNKLINDTKAGISIVLEEYIKNKE